MKRGPIRTPHALGPPVPSADRGRGPELPAWRAFVVQFTRANRGRRAPFAGRVEHLYSGHRVRFESRDELLAVLTTLLEEFGGQ